MTSTAPVAKTIMVGLYYAAAATTAIAGILHLVLASNILGFNTNTGIFFIVAGIAQIFWVVPLIKRWGLPWYLAGIGGTIILVALWAITRMPGNPVTGRAGSVNEMGIVIEVMQVAFIGLAAAIIVYEIKRNRPDRHTAAGSV